MQNKLEEAERIIDAELDFLDTLSIRNTNAAYRELMLNRSTLLNLLGRATCQTNTLSAKKFL